MYAMTCSAVVETDTYIWLLKQTDGIRVDGMCKAGVLGYLFLFLLVVSRTLRLLGS